MYKCKVRMDFRHFTKGAKDGFQFFKEDEYLFFVENGTYFIRRENGGIPGSNFDTSLLKGVPFTEEEFKKYFISLRKEKLDKLLNNLK